MREKKLPEDPAWLAEVLAQVHLAHEFGGGLPFMALPGYWRIVASYYLGAISKLAEEKRKESESKDRVQEYPAGPDRIRKVTTSKLV